MDKKQCEFCKHVQDENDLPGVEWQVIEHCGKEGLACTFCIQPQRAADYWRGFNRGVVVEREACATVVQEDAEQYQEGYHLAVEDEDPEYSRLNRERATVLFSAEARIRARGGEAKS